MKVEDALSKSFKLEQSLQELQELDDCNSILCDSFIDSESDELSILHQAATILRQRISKTKGLGHEYYSASELRLEAQRDFLDPLLLRFINWLSCKPKLNEAIDTDDITVDKKTVAICSDIMALVKPMITPKHLGLTVFLHHSYGSKKLIEDLNSHGYTLPYSEIRHFLTSAAVHMSNIQQQTESGGIVPLHMASNEESSGLIVAAADNWDHNENTLGGKRSTHAMTSILVKSSSSNVQPAQTRIPRVQDRSIDTTSLPGNGLSHTLMYKQPESRPEPILNPPVKLEELNTPEPKSFKQLRLKELLYNLGRNRMGGMVDDRSEMPPWTVFQSNIQTDILSDKANIVFNPIIMSTPNDYNTVYTVLKRTKEQINALGQSVCPIVFDMGLLAKAREVVWARPEELSGVVPLEGGMHFLMSLFGGIGYIYGDAGLKDMMVESDVFAKLTAEHILSGKDFDRALCAILMIDEVLNRRFLLQFDKWAEKNSKQIPSELLRKIDTLDIQNQTEEVETVLEMIQSGLLPALEMFRSEGRSASSLFRFWDDYLTEVSLPFKMYLAASRHGIWDMYHFAKLKLLPFLFSSNRTVYSRYMPYMVLQMNRLPEDIINCFKNGEFVSKLTAGSFNAVWYDYILEVTENKALKSSGGIIGITHNDQALTRWFLSRPITARYAMIYSSNQAASSTKHHTDTPFHTQAYNDCVTKMLDLFQTESFIDPFSLDFPLSRLVNIATGVEVAPDVESSLLKCHETGQKQLISFVEQRLMVNEDGHKKSFYDPLPRSKVKTINAAKSVGQTKPKAQMNGEETYLRLLAINSFKKVPLDRVLSFENAHVPLSLFTDDECMMSNKKSDFLEKLESLAGSENILRSIEPPDSIVFDGMAIIQMLPAPTDSKQTYQQMAAAFWSHVFHCSTGVSNIHMVFDRYEPNSLKSQTRQKRGENVSSHVPVSMQNNMVIVDWKKLLASIKSKQELTKLYTKYLTENCHELLQDNVIVLISGGIGQKALRVSKNVVSFEQELESDHEEADTRMILHLAFAGSFGAKKAVIVSPDTDVFVLLVHHYMKLQVEHIFFKTGRRGKHSNNTRYIPVHTVYNALLPDERAILLPVYCITGCDTCSSFHGIGKKKAFQVLRKSASQLVKLSDLGSEPTVSGPVKVDAISFVGLLYGSSQCKSLNTLRKTMVLEKSNVKPRKLPPTNDSFTQHLLRCSYQLQVWRRATESKLNLPSPLEFGYYIDSQTGFYTPKLMSQSAAAPELLSDLVCTCNDKCSNNCICSHNEQPCTQACHCKGCLQESDCCENLFTMLAHVCTEDSSSLDNLL